MKPGFVAILVLAAAAPAAAQQEEPKPPPPQPVKPERKVVVTATRTAREEADGPVPTQVVTAKDLETMGVQNAGHALRRIPGLILPGLDAFPGARVEVYSQGLPSDQLLVLVDGQRVRGSHSGAIDLSEIALEHIERIEIVKGPGSSVYGSDAIAGVVHIITKSAPKAEPGKLVSVGSTTLLGGSERTSIARGLYSLTEGPASALLSASLQDTDGLDRESRFTGSTAFAKGSYRTESGIFTLQGGWYDETFPDSDRRKSNVQLGWTHSASRDLHLDGAVRFFRVDSDSQAVIIVPLAFESTEDEVEFDLHGEYTGWSSQSLSFGLSWRREQIDSNAFPDAESQSFGGIFLQDEVRLFDDRLTVIVGARVDDYSESGTQVNPRTGVRFRISEETSVRAWSGRGYKAPQLGDLFNAFDHGFAILKGNPDLEPEESISWQLGLDHRFGSWASVSLTGFRNDIEDLIEFSKFLGGTFIPGRGFVPILGTTNVDRARTMGVEASASFTMDAEWTSGISYTYLSARDIESDDPLDLRPRHTYVGWVTYAPASLGLSTTIEGRYVDEQPVSGGQDRIGDIFVLNLKAAYPLWKGAKALLVVNNLLDRRYEFTPGTDMPGTNFLLGTEMKF